MIAQFAKNDNVQLSANFYTDDFKCHCSFPDCVSTYIDEELIICLEDLFDIAEHFKINSGFRCAKWNEQVGGETKSFHLYGLAADIQSLNGLTGNQMANLAAKIDSFNNGGIGTANDWIHCDVRKTGKARWTYPILRT